MCVCVCVSVYFLYIIYIYIKLDRNWNIKKKQLKDHNVLMYISQFNYLFHNVVIQQFKKKDIFNSFV